ncbi:MAG TPA: Calx-beta domain-containing protein [Pyrinomonadaceae bacterium]|nr:Calx-beta domain-containing protein [Pyrinomonadaceae bacterium]
MKLIKFLTYVCLCLLTSGVCQAQHFKLPGDFTYALNSIRPVMDVSPDGKIAAALRSDPVSVHPARLTTFDPVSGKQFDSKTFGFGPLGVQLARVGDKLRAVVLTSEGGPRKIYLFDVSAAGKLTQLASTKITDSIIDGGSNIVLSGSAQVGFALVASNELITFSLVNGAILKRSQTYYSDTLVMNEAGGKRLLAFQDGPGALGLLDVSVPTDPVTLPYVPLPPTSEWSGIGTPGLAFSGDGRYVFVGNHFVNFSVVDVAASRVVTSMGGDRRCGRVRVFEDGTRRLLAIQSTTAAGSTPRKGVILLVDATDPTRLSVIKQYVVTDSGSYKSDLAFSRDGSKLFVVGTEKLMAFNLPTFTRAWERTVPGEVTIEHQVAVFGQPEEVLGAWQISDTFGFISIFGSFPANPPGISVADTTAAGDSGTSAADFTVTLSAPSNRTVTVDYSTAGGVATQGSDYQDTRGTLTFAPGETSKTVTVPLIADSLDEADETFTLNLSAPTIGIIARGKGTCAILDDDPPPAVSVNDVGVTEGDSGVKSVAFSVSLSQPSAKQITLSYATADGAAKSVSDYVARSGVLTFAPGQSSKTIVVAVVGDTVTEAGEGFAIKLTNPTNVTVADGQGVCTITDNDLPPSLRVSSPSVTEGNAAVTANFTVTLSAPSAQTVTVNYATANGTATAPADYAAKALTTLTFTPGQTTKTVAVTVAGDFLDEPAENFKLVLSNPANAIIAAGTGTCTVTDNDPPPSVAIGNAAVTEPDSGTRAAVFTIKLSAPSGQPVTVKYATADGATNPAAAGTDYTAVALTTLTFLPGQTSKTVVVQAKGDLLREPSETFFVNLSGAAGAAILDAQGLGTITNDD